MIIKMELIGEEKFMLSFLETYLPWLNVQQLNILNIKYDYLLFFIILVIIFILNKLTMPILRWIMNKNFLTLLSYLMTSTIVLVITYTFSYKIDYMPMKFIKLVFYAIVIFGIYLTIILTYKMLKKEA